VENLDGDDGDLRQVVFDVNHVLSVRPTWTHVMVTNWRSRGQSVRSDCSGARPTAIAPKSMKRPVNGTEQSATEKGTGNTHSHASRSSTATYPTAVAVATAAHLTRESARPGRIFLACMETLCATTNALKKARRNNA